MLAGRHRTSTKDRRRGRWSWVVVVGEWNRGWEGEGRTSGFWRAIRAMSKSQCRRVGQVRLDIDGESKDKGSYASMC